jgi:gamma-polyglutamate biosynthesis protein CapA
MRIALLGDIAFFGKYSVEENPGVYDYFREVAEYLRGFDHVVGNLETPLAEPGTRPYGSKSAHIRAHPANVALLQFLGIDVVNLSNNHIWDYGLEGYRRTLGELERAGIPFFGVEGRQLELRGEAAAVALHGYCSWNTNPLGVSRRGGPGIDPLEVNGVKRRLRENAAAGLLNVVSVHSGQEHVNYPSRDDIRMAREFAEVCPYVYYGHHPHVLQGCEERDGSVIAYSLGNFCFDDVYTPRSDQPLLRQTDNNRAGAILEIEVRGGSVAGHRMTPVYAGPSSLRVGVEAVGQQLAGYSRALDEEEPGYTARRDGLIREFLDGRKTMRDLRWYLARLNLNSVGVLARARYNQRQYDRMVRDQLRG